MKPAIDPWTTAQIENYKELFDTFGIKPFTPFVKKLKDPHLLMKRGVVIGHRDFDRIYDAIKNKEDFAMLTGLMPSGPFHFGHKMVADQIIWYQKQGAEVFITVADIEAYAVRNIPLEKCRETAINEYIANYIALGLKPKKAHIYFQSDYKKEYYRLKSMISKRATLNEFKAIYGDDISPAKINAVLHQVADILHPQLPEFGGKRPVIVPVGVDQDPHIRLTRDIASRASEFDFILPSSTYHRFQTGIRGGKMSSSKPESFIALNENPEIAVKKLKTALTGGRDTVEEQKKLGGTPENCVIYEFYLYHLIPDDKELKKVYENCRAGKLLCGENKARAVELLEKFLKEHQKKLEKARNQVDKYITS